MDPTLPLPPSSGGTGQTFFTRGDILVSPGDNLLVRLPVGADGNVLSSNSLAPTGIAWVAPGSTPATTTTPGQMRIASVEEVIQGTDTSKAVTPATLSAAFMSPNVIGGSSCQDAYFDNLSCGSLSGTVQAKFGDLESTDKVVSPAQLRSIIQSSSVAIGSNKEGNISLPFANFGNLKTTNLQVIGLPPWPVYAFANESSVLDVTSSNEIVSPSLVPTIFSQPPALGSRVPNAAKFTTLECQNINVQNPPWSQPKLNFATQEDITEGTDESKVINPKVLANTLRSIPEVTKVNQLECASSGSFQSIHTNTLTGPIATSDDIKSKAEGKILTTDNVETLFAQGFHIGTAGKGIANVTTLTADTVLGDCIVDISKDLQDQSEKIVTASALSKVLQSPPPFGSQNPNDARFLEINVDRVSGKALAEPSDIKDPQSDKLVTPSGLALIFSHPPILGSQQPNSATFTNVTTDSITSTNITTEVVNSTIVNAQIGQEQCRANAFINVLDATSMNLKDIHAESVYGQLKTPQKDIFASTLTTETYVSTPTLYGKVGDSTTSHEVYASTIVASKVYSQIGDLNNQQPLFATDVSCSKLESRGDVKCANLDAGMVSGHLIGQLGKPESCDDAYVQSLSAVSSISSPLLTSSMIYGQVGDSSKKNNVFANTLNANKLIGTLGDASTRNAVNASSVTSTTINNSGNIYSAGPVYGQVGDQSIYHDVHANTVYGNCLHGQIGDGIAPTRDGYFSTITGNQLYGSLGDSSNRDNVFASKIECTEIAISESVKMKSIQAESGVFQNISGNLGNQSSKSNAIIADLSCDAISCSKGTIGRVSISNNELNVDCPMSVGGLITCHSLNLEDAVLSGNATIFKNLTVSGSTSLRNVSLQGNIDISGNLQCEAIQTKAIKTSQLDMESTNLEIDSLVTQDLTIQNKSYLNLVTAKSVIVDGPVSSDSLVANSLASHSAVADNAIIKEIDTQSIVSERILTEELECKHVNTKAINTSNLCVEGLFDSSSKDFCVLRGIHVQGSLSSTGSLSVDGSSSLHDTTCDNLITKGSLIVNNTAAFRKDASIDGSLSIAQDLHVRGRLSFKDEITAISVSSDGDIITNGSLYATKELSIGGDITSQNICAANIDCASIGIESNLSVGGNVSIQDLYIAGVTHSNGSFQVGGDIKVSGSLHSGDAYVSDLSAKDINVSNIVADGNLSCQSISATEVWSTGDISGGNLSVKSLEALDATFKSDVTTLGSFSALGKCTIGLGLLCASVNTGNVSCKNVNSSGWLSVVGDITSQGALYVGSNTLTDTKSTLSGDLSVGKSILAEENVSCRRLHALTTVDCDSLNTRVMTSGSISCSSVTVGSTSVDANLKTGKIICDDVTMNGSLSVSGDVCCGSILASGITLKDGTVIGAKGSGCSLTLSDSLSIGGVFSGKSAIFSKDVTVGDLTATSIDVSGSVKIQNSVSMHSLATDSIICRGRLMSGPLQCESISSSGDISVANFTALGNSTVSGDLTVDGSMVLGGSLQLSGGVIMSESLFVQGSISTKSMLDSTSIDTGSLVASGGLGVRKNTYIGGLLSVRGGTFLQNSVTLTSDSTSPVLVVNSQLDASSKSSASAVFSGGMGIGKSLIVGGDFSAGNATLQSLNLISSSTTPVFTVSGMMDATATNSASAVFSGGVGIGRDLMVGGNVTSQNLTCQKLDVGNLSVASDLKISGNITIEKVTSLNTDDSVSATTGSAVFKGGVGIKKSLNVGGDVSMNSLKVFSDMLVYSDLDATSVDCASAVFSGGVGIEKSMYVGGDVAIGGKMMLSGLADGEILIGRNGSVEKLAPGKVGQVLMMTTSGPQWTDLS